MEIKQAVKICSVEHCEKKVVAKGLCAAHYKRNKLYGDPTRIKQVQHHGLTLRERFSRYVKKTDDCWLWIGGRDNNGYGKLNVDGKPRLASRLSWMLHFGDIPDGKYVCHKCDNPPCVNPDHLFIGDQIDNVKDMIDKGRARRGTTSGTDHHNAKATEELVRHIRKNGDPSQAFADSVGLSRATVHAILKGETWKHVK